MKDIRETLNTGRPLLFDGAMGTYFAQTYPEERCELASLTRPNAIRSIHRAYLEAGCQAIKTNTFTVSADLAQGRDELAAQIVQASCRLALEEARPFGACVFGDIGPAPEGAPLSRGENYLRQAELLLGQGVRCFLAETLSSDEGLEELARGLKARCPEAFLLVSFAVAFDGTTREGCSATA